MEKQIKLELTEQEFKCLSSEILQPIINGTITCEETTRLSLMGKVLKEFRSVGLDKKIKFNSYYDSYYKARIEGEEHGKETN